MRWRPESKRKTSTQRGKQSNPSPLASSFLYCDVTVVLQPNPDPLFMKQQHMVNRLSSPQSVTHHWNPLCSNPLLLCYRIGNFCLAYWLEFSVLLLIFISFCLCSNLVFLIISWHQCGKTGTHVSCPVLNDDHHHSCTCFQMRPSSQHTV